MLSQGPVGSDKPVAYASRTLSDTESRYSTIERELLAVVWAVKHFKPYLYGKKFTIYTDHRPLAWLYSLKEPNSKLTNWRLRLEEYNFEIKYKKGPQNTNADALSRIQIHTLDDDDISMQVNVDKNDEKFDIDEFVKNTTTKMLEGEKSEENSDIPIISISDSDTSNHTVKSNQEIELETLESDDGATAHSISNREHEGIPILNESIDTKPKQIMIFTWSRNKFDVKDISNGKQRILEVHMPTNNKELIKKFLK